MRPKSVFHVVFFLAGLGGFALPFFNISVVAPNGASERIGQMEGYKFVIGGEMTMANPQLSRVAEAVDTVKRQAADVLRDLNRAVGLDNDNRSRVPGDWRGWLAVAGLLVGVVALLARLPLGNVLAGLGGLASMVGLGLMAYEERGTQALFQTEIAHGLLITMLCGFLGMMVSWVGWGRAKKKS